jgi:hypothetical protein
MPADLEEKTDRYGEMLADALDTADPAAPPGTPLGEAAAETYEMAQSYLDDGRHFRDTDDPVNALASFSYGYGWLDAGVRFGLFDIPDETELFTTEAP